MKLKTIHLDDNEDPVSVTVEIGWRELALIESVLGNISPGAITEVLGAQWVDAFEDVVRGGDIFGRFYEDGITDVLRSQGNLLLKLGETQERLTAEYKRREEG